MKLNNIVKAIVVMGVALPGSAAATNGMFASGYGMVANGMGGRLQQCLNTLLVVRIIQLPWFMLVIV
jgi:hypothetical protein